MDKPFKTIDEQVSILAGRGMAVDEGTAGVLRREGYYPVVNGYKDLFIDAEASERAGQDAYAEGTRFSDVYRLFSFDRDLRLAMFRYFAHAEAVLKTTCAYEFCGAHRDEREPYLDLASYRGDGRYRSLVPRLIEDFRRILNRHPYEGRGFKRGYIEHYARHHDEVPFWVLVKFLTLGQTFMFFDCQPERVRNAVAKAFSGLRAEAHPGGGRISPRALTLAYDHIKDFRNICAHDERLFCARVSPSRDVSFARLLDDLSMVLARDEYARMQAEIAELVLGLYADLGSGLTESVLTRMGLVEEGGGRALLLGGRR